MFFFKSVLLGIAAQGFAQRSSAVYREKQWSGLHGSTPVGRYGAIRVSLFELCTAIQQVNCPLFGNENMHLACCFFLQSADSRSNHSSG